MQQCLDLRGLPRGCRAQPDPGVCWYRIRSGPAGSSLKISRDVRGVPAVFCFEGPCPSGSPVAVAPPFGRRLCSQLSLPCLLCKHRGQIGPARLLLCRFFCFAGLCPSGSPVAVAPPWAALGARGFVAALLRNRLGHIGLGWLLLCRSGLGTGGFLGFCLRGAAPQVFAVAPPFWLAWSRGFVAALLAFYRGQIGRAAAPVPVRLCRTGLGAQK